MASAWTGNPSVQMALALGVAGGGIGLFLGILSAGSDASSSDVGVVIVVSVIALVGAGLTTTKPLVAAILLLFAGIGGFIGYWGGVWLVPGVLLFGGSLAAWNAGRATPT